MESDSRKSARTGDARALMSTPDPITREIQRAVANIGQLKARQLLREMREREDALQKARKAEKRRQFEMGVLVVRCGLKDWDTAELAGLLVDGKTRAEQSPTMRLSFRKHGEQFLSLSTSTTLH